MATHNHLLRPAPWTPNPALAPSRGTDRLLLRAYTQSDSPQLFASVARSREALLPWLPWAKTQHLSVEDSAQSIALFTESWRDPLKPEHNATFGFVMGIFDQTTGELLGGTGFNRLDPYSHNAELGYWLDIRARGKGICTAATRALLDWAFEPQSTGGFGLRRVHIFAAERNTASCAVPRRLGLRQHLHSTQERWVDDIGWCDILGWEVLAPLDVITTK
jgi:ribosomal-protein-serine acetyltransferase